MAQEYRLAEPLVGVSGGKGLPISPVTIPAGATVEAERPSGVVGLALVRWDGRVLSVFANDLLARILALS